MIKVVDKSKISSIKSDYTVLALSHSIDILELLSVSEHELTFNEIVNKLKLTKNNASKILGNLEYFDFIETNKITGNYRLGVRTFQLSQSYIRKLNLINVSNSVLNSLKQKFNESSYIGILRNGNVVYLNVVETSEPVRVMPRTGNVGPAYATAIGKAQLSVLSDREISYLYENKNFLKLTPNTIGNIDDLLKDIEVVRKRGYALDLEEYEEEVYCIAVPIIDYAGKVIAGLSISGPKCRLTEDRIINEIAPVLLEEARSLSIKFGYMGNNN